MKTIKLKDVSINNRGEYGIGASACNYITNYKYLRITDITEDSKIYYNKLLYVDERKVNKYLLKPNDIVFARTGNSTGKNYYIDREYKNLVFAGFLIKFSLDENKCVPKYIKYYCQSNKYKSWVKNHITGSTRPNLNEKNFANMEIKLPPLIEQKEIADCLSSFDDKIENNEDIINSLENISSELYKRWFIDFEFPNEEGLPYKSNGGEFKESELGVIPIDWKVIKLKEILDFKTGFEPSAKNYKKRECKDDIPFFRVKDLNKRQNIYIDKKINKIEKNVKYGEVLVSFDGTVGRVVNELEGAYSTGIKKVSAFNNEMTNELIYLVMKSDSIQRTIKDNAIGTTILHASKAIDFLTISYNKRIIKKFESNYNLMIHKILELKKENEILKKIRDELIEELIK